MRRRPRLIPRRRAIAVATAALVAGLLGLGGAAVAAPAHPAAGRAAGGSSASEYPSGVTVSVFAANGGLVAPGQDATVSVVIENGSAQAVQPGDVALSLDNAPFTDETALGSWLAAPTATDARALVAGPSSAVASGGSAIVATLTVPAATLAFSDIAGSVWGITAAVTTPDGALPTAASTLVWQGTQPARVPVAIAMPLTVPGRGEGLISSAELASYTGPDGVLSRELDLAQQDPAVAVGIDPMILASIRVLGSSAPESAKTWLTSLAAIGNETFALQYGDADAAAEIQAGLAAPLAPTSLDYAMKPGDFQSPLTVGEPSPTPNDAQDGMGEDVGSSASTPTPSPTSTAAPSRLPTLDELLDWPYTLSGVVWPAASSVRGADLTALAQSGLTTAILSADNSTAPTLGGTSGAALHIGASTALVADDALSTALADAASASSVLTAGRTTAVLTAQLALDARSAPAGAVLLATLDRGAPASVEAAVGAVQALTGSPFATPVPLATAIGSAQTPGLQLVDRSEDATRIAAIGSLLDQEGDQRTGGTAPVLALSAFSSVLVQPELLTGPNRALLLSLLSVSWSPTAPDWQTAVTDALSSNAKALDAIQIVSPLPIRQLSNQVRVPITVTNKLAYPVKVVLRAIPSSARLEIDSDTTKTIPAGSSANVLIPVKAQVSNGKVQLALQLFSTTGIPIGAGAQATVHVHADWEGIGAAIFGIVVVGFFAFGIVRTVRRRRRERRAEDDGEEPDGDTPHDDGPDAPSAEQAHIPAEDPAHG